MFWNGFLHSAFLWSQSVQKHYTTASILILWGKQYDFPQNCTFSPDFRAHWYTQSFRLSVCYYLDDFSYGEDDRHVDEAAAGSRQLVYKCSSNRGLSFKLSGRVVYNTLSTKPRKVIRLSAMSLFHDWAKSKIERILCWYTVASYSRMMKLVASS